jgi:hypothetical protein
MLTPILSFLGVRHAECIIGDLDEERALRRQETTCTAAAGWYAWQLSRLLARSLTGRLISIAIAVAPPLFLLQGLWTALFGYFCLEPAPGLPLVNTVFVLAGTMLALPSRRIPVSAFVCAGLVLALSLGPATYPLLIAGMVAIPAGLLTAQIQRTTA